MTVNSKKIVDPGALFNNKSVKDHVISLDIIDKAYSMLGIIWIYTSLHCALGLAAQCIVIGPVCNSGACSGRAVSEPYYSQRAQSLRLSEGFFTL